MRSPSQAGPETLASGQRRGILTFCYGTDDKYVRQAQSLARSIRLRSPDLPIAVASDRPEAAFEGLFDQIIPFDFAPLPGTTAKLALAEITPFDQTLFIDSDCLFLRKAEALFDFFGSQEFGVFGANLPKFSWAESASQVHSIVPAAVYPSFNGGLYFFRRSALASEVFSRARSFGARYDQLDLTRPRGRHNDELLIALAMASLGLEATIADDLVPMVAPELPARDLQLDVLAGYCRFVRRGEIVEPAVIHFVGSRDLLPAYRREQWVLRFIGSGGWPRWTRGVFHLAAIVENLARRAKGRVARML